MRAEENRSMSRRSRAGHVVGNRDAIVAVGLVAAILSGCSGAEPPPPEVAIATSASAPAPAPPSEPDGAACARLDAPTRSKLLKLFVTAPDPRAEGCAIKALEDYRPDETEDDVRSAARIVAALKSRRAAPSLFEVFGKVRASRPRAQTIYRDVFLAMDALGDKSWTPKLLAALEPAVDEHDTRQMLDQQFWQVTAAHILGKMGVVEAVRPLIKIVLSPAKMFAGTTAVLALVNIGKPSIAPAVALLRGEDAELVVYSTKETLAALSPRAPAAQTKGAAFAHVGIAALILATIGRDDVEAPLLAALSHAPDDITRAIVARELTKLPKTAATLAAFQRAYEKTPPPLSVPPGIGARETLLDASGMFFDSSLVSWYVDTATAMKGDESDLVPIREASFVAALKLAKPDQMSKVEVLARRKTTAEGGRVSTLGAGYTHEMSRAKDLLATCGDKIDCYIRTIGEPRAQEQDNQFVGIKAAYMIGVLGSPAARQAIVAQLPNVTNPAVRFVAVTVLDYLSPKGDVALADQLQAIVDAGEASKDPNRIAGNSPFKTVIYRLRARAQ
jgi:hypothetical protein